MDLSKNLHPGGGANASSKPHSPESKVEHCSDHMLRNVSNCFAQGAVIIHPSEEVSGGEERGSDLTRKLQLTSTPSVVFSQFRKRIEVLSLEGFDELLWNFKMAGTSDRLTVIGTSVSSSLCHVSVGEVVVEVLFRKLFVMS